MACKTWYIKYQTKQECLDAEEFERIPVEFGSITTALATTKMSTTRRTSTSATEMTVTTYSNTDLVDSLADLPAVYYEDDFADEAKTFDDKDKTTVAAQVPGDETSVLMRAKVKAGIGFDGKLLTFFFSVEFVGGAMLLILLYKGMEVVLYPTKNASLKCTVILQSCYSHTTVGYSHNTVTLQSCYSNTTVRLQ